MIMGNFSGITTEQFKMLCPDFKDIYGDEVWDMMTLYVGMRQKHIDTAVDSRTLGHVYPDINFTINLVNEYDRSNNYYSLYLHTKLRVRSREDGWWYIIKLNNSMTVDHKADLVYIVKDFLYKSHCEIYNHLHLYIPNTNLIDPIQDRQLDIFDIYQGSEYHRLMELKIKTFKYE
jgi:hypothetical protein